MSQEVLSNRRPVLIFLVLQIVIYMYIFSENDSVI